MPRSVQVYAWGLCLVGCTVWLWYIPRLTWALLVPGLGLALCAYLFERFPMLLPNRISFSLASVMVWIAYTQYGMPAAVLAQSLAAGATILRSRRMVQKAFNAGQLLVSLGLMHMVILLLGRWWERGGHFEAAVLLTGGLVFLIANAVLVGGVMWLMNGKPYLNNLTGLLQEGRAGILGCLALILPLLSTYRTGKGVAFALVAVVLLAFRYAVSLYLEQKRTHLEALEQLSRVVARKAGAPESHAARVGRLARAVAERLKLSADEVDTIHAAGLLHDIGEAEVDQRVVSVMARRAIPTLTDVEAYRNHAALGAELVGRMEGMKVVAPLIRHHHEAWDGSGYPEGVRGEAIPLGARILAAVEAVESAADDPDGKRAALSRMAGTVIDPSLTKVVEEAFLKAEEPVNQVAAIQDEAGLSLLQAQILRTVRGSRLLDTLGVARVLTHENGAFTDFLGRDAEPPARTEVERLVQQCRDSQLPVRDHVVEQGIAYDVYCIPAGSGVVSLMLFNVSQALAEEREHTRRIFRAYRDVMLAATRGKLRLLEAEELAELLAEGRPAGSLELAEPAHNGLARELIWGVASRLSMDPKALFRLAVCTSEAVTNVFKHAGKGRLSLHLGERFLRVVVQDQGEGIPYEILPQAVLLEGYSTKRSMGKGFSILLEYLDRIWLQTDSSGTVIIMEKSLPPDRAATWEVVREAGGSTGGGV